MTIQNPRLQRMFDSDSAIMLDTLTRMLARTAAGRIAEPDIARAFRAAHSIKSEAGFLNETEVAEAAHRLEDSLAEARALDGQVDESLATSIRAGVRALSAALAAYQARGRAASPETSRQPPAETTETARDETTARAAAAERGMLREARQRGERVYRFSVAIASPPELRYARAFLVVNNLELSSAVIRTEPPLERVQETPVERISVVITGPADEQLVRDSVERAVHVDEVELIDFAETSFDELLDGSPGDDPGGAGRLQALRPFDSESQEEVRLFAEEIVAAIDELAETGATSPGASGDTLARIRAYAGFLRDRMSRGAPVQLLDVLREIRANAVRYAARQGKRVRVAVGGHGALVSATVGDTLLEAAMHLVRNSIDHGIGTLAQRATAGRHPAATIKVRVDRVGNAVRVVLKDDGDGVDEQAVRERTGDTSASLLDILARPGFSMRPVPDATSGRGVGLDNVVHSVRDLLGGDIRMVNRPGAGLSFVINVPATARLVHVYLVEAGGNACAVPSATVVAKAPLERRKLRRDSFGALYYEHEGRALPLSTVTGRSPGPRGLHETTISLVVRAGSDMRVLVVDQVVAEEAVVREDARTGTVYSRSLARDVPFVFPAALAWDGESGRVRGGA